MTTEVIVTGTGVPVVSPQRAGPGVLVRHQGQVLQFDAGLATALRLIEAGVSFTDISALFITHHHTDHISGVPEVVISRYLQNPMNQPEAPLPTIAPVGIASHFLEHMLEPMAPELAERTRAPRQKYPEIELRAFDAAEGDLPAQVWCAEGVTVTAFGVVHGWVVPAVGYRVETPDGLVVISGDTSVCDTLEEAAQGADILVNEVVCSTLADIEQQHAPPMEFIRRLHSETRELGAMAQRCGVKTLVLTHLVPPVHPDDTEALAVFASDIRDAGFNGEIVVAADLDRVTIGGS